ncbi:hypothetical protein AB9F47_30485 [Rhizobium leguminosarum]|uniref:hypothetical protein n=1 Tax=Rhizobium leguminosarum TaxID=384 RepID=UPI003F946F95
MSSSWKHILNPVPTAAAIAMGFLAMHVNEARAEQQLTSVAIQRLQDALQGLKDQDPAELASLLQFVRIVVSNDDLISRNPLMDGRLIYLLANASSTPDYSIRIQGGWLLANLTSQNNVCGIIETLFNPNIDIKARGNLLEIVGNQVSQMPPDVSAWLKAALDRPTTFKDTRADRIKGTLIERLAPAPLETLKDSSPRDFTTCINLPNIGSTYVGMPPENAPFSIYIHAGKADPAEVNKVKDSLVKAGFNVEGVDNDVDRAGTGVDYSLKGPDTSVALRKAAAISSIVYQSINRTIGTRAQSLTPLGTFGVWL